MPMVDWDFSLLQSLIDDRGDQVVWEKGAPCPQCTEQDPFANALPKEGRPPTKSSIFCDMCLGDGRIYRDPQVIRALVTGIQAGNRTLLEMGFAMPGDMVLSPPLTIFLSVEDFDRITLTTATGVSEGQVIVRGAANTGENKFLKTNLALNEDRLWYLAEDAILCEDVNGKTYESGTDYIFDDKKIVWIGNQPKVGIPYVIKYSAYVEWMVYSTSLDRLDHGRDLAPKVMLRKKHVYFFNGMPGESPGARQEEAIKFQSVSKL